MFIREVRNRSGSVSIQIISKANGKYKVIKTIGFATVLQDIENLKIQAKQEMEKIQQQTSLFLSEEYLQVEKAFSQVANLECLKLILGYDLYIIKKVKNINSNLQSIYSILCLKRTVKSTKY